MLLDYSVFHRETKKDLDKYHGYIHQVACNCLVHSDFLGPADYSRIQLDDLFDHYSQQYELTGTRTGSEDDTPRRSELDDNDSC